MANEDSGLWVALAAAGAYVFLREGRRKFFSRMGSAAIACGLGYTAAVSGVAPDQNRALVAAVITALAQPFLDTAAAVLGDAAFVKESLRQFLQRWTNK